ncbi:hypothetical protein Tco_0167394 [Tanacetum coccineum]
MSISEDEFRTNDDEYESRKEHKRGKELLIQLVKDLFVYPAGRTNRRLMRSKDLLLVCSNGGVGVGIQLFVHAIERTLLMSELNLASGMVTWTFQQLMLKLIQKSTRKFMKYMVMLGTAETLRYGFTFYDNNASVYHVVSICSKDWHYTRMSLHENGTSM